MKTIEQIVDGVNPDMFIAANSLTIADRKFAQRAIKNFRPLVEALQYFARNGDGGGGEIVARTAIANALKEEP